MSELLKVGTKSTSGTAKPAVSDFDGVLSVADSGRYIPRRSSNYADNLALQRKMLKAKYVENEAVIAGGTGNIRDRWSSIEPKLTMDTSVHAYGDDVSMKFTFSTPTWVSKIFSESININNFDFFSMWINIEMDSLEKLATFIVRFDSPDPQNRYSINLLNEAKRYYGKGVITINKSDFVTTGNPDPTDVKAVIVEASTTNGDEAYIHFSNIKFVKQKPTRGKILWRIDDGYKQVYDVAMPIFRKYNVPASIFINPGFVSLNDDEHLTHVGYNAGLPAMNLKEIKELHAMGWSVCSHTWYHNLYSDPLRDISRVRNTYGQAWHDLAAVQDWLIDNGFADTAYGHGYGNNYYSAETLAAEKDLFLIPGSRRPNISVYNTLPWSESLTVSFADNNNGAGSDVCTPVIVDGETTYPMIDKVIEEKGLLQICGHRFEPVDPATGSVPAGAITPESLDAMLEYAFTKGGVDFITIKDLAEASPVALL